MANVSEAADQLRELVQNWADANDLDQTLEDLHEWPRAMQEALHNYAENLRENTNLGEHIPDVIEEAGADMQGIADKLKETIQYGVQQN